MSSRNTSSLANYASRVLKGSTLLASQQDERLFRSDWEENAARRDLEASMGESDTSDARLMALRASELGPRSADDEGSFVQPGKSAGARDIGAVDSQSAPTDSPNRMFRPPRDSTYSFADVYDQHVEAKGWRAHETTAALSTPSDASSSERLLREVAVDPWNPPAIHCGFRQTPQETASPADALKAPEAIARVYPASVPGKAGHLTLSTTRDAPWLVAWTLNLLFLASAGIWVALQDVPSQISNNMGASAVALLSSLPQLTASVIIALLASSSAMAYLFLVRRSVRHLMYGATISAPILLLLTAAWSWASSWRNFGQADSENDAERSTLRVFSLMLIVSAICVAKLCYERRHRIERTVSVIQVAADVLLVHPQLFAVCLATMGAFLVFSGSLMTVLARLLLIASSSTEPSTPTFLAIYTAFVWMWTLGVLRGVQKLTIARTVGQWYFRRHDPEALTASTLVGDSFRTATKGSLGSACYAALVLAMFDSVAVILKQLRRLTRLKLPLMFTPLMLCAPFVAFAASVFEGLSSFALAFAGITGKSFWESAKDASALIARTGSGCAIDYLLLKLTLNIVSLTVSSGFGLAGYLSAANAITQHHAGFVGVVCFAIPFWTMRFCTDMLSHTVDAIFICWSLDVDLNQNHCTKAAQAFAEPTGAALAV